MTGGKIKKQEKSYSVHSCACGCNKDVGLSKKYIIGHNRRKSSNINKIVYLYVKRKFSLSEISRTSGYSVNRIKRCLRQRNIKLRSRKQAAIIAAQKGKFYMQAERGKREHSRKMKGRSYNRIYNYSRDIFKSLNSKTAYLLGYICADGCVSREGKLMFATKDKVLLEKINLVFQSNKPIRSYENGKYFRLEFSSNEINNDLLKLGVIPKKPLRLYPLNMPKNIYHDFVRGYFDGDGCFAYHVSNDIYKSMVTSSNYEVLKWMHNIMPTRRGTIYKRTPNCFELRYGFEDTVKLGNFIYGGLRSTDVYLPRKFILFQKIKKLADTKRFKKQVSK
ncbi:MAG: LAGLIDADG family homing endonuclease [Candidatus Omnitrophota bacterium]